MRRALLGLWLLGSVACSRSGSSGCRQDPSFDRSRVFRVQVDARPEALHNDLSLVELAKLTPSVGPGKLQGLTSVDHQFAVRSRIGLNGDHTCAWYEEVVVDLTPVAVDILIPSEYPQGTCEYEAVLAHEHQHKEAHRERLAAVAAAMDKGLRSALWLPTRGNPIIVADRPTAEKELGDRLGKVIHPPYETFKTELDAAQKALDTPDAYAWVRKRCHHWK